MNSTSASKSDANGAWVGGSFPVIAMAASAGGLKALSVILGGLPENFPAAIAIVMHLAPDHKSLLAEILDARSRLEVKQADTGDFLCPSCVFVAPPNRHLSVAPDGRLKLSSPSAQKVNHARPSAEPLFATVAEVYGKKAIAVVLTGGDGDGSFGVQVIKDEGGKVIAQDRPTSQDFSMPKTAIQTGDVDFVLPLDEIAAKLIELVAATVGAHSDAAQVARGQTPAPPAAGGEQRGEMGRRPAEAPLSSLVPRGEEEKPRAMSKGDPRGGQKGGQTPPRSRMLPHNRPKLVTPTVRSEPGPRRSRADNARMKKKSSPSRSRKSSAKAGSAETVVAPASASFPIVGIGASAGGLEALEQFLGHVPKQCGMAFVIVQHLDPTHKGIMPELLQRATGMKVIQVKDRMAVRPDCVFVIPPNKDMSILHGVLHLLAPAAPRGLRLPIDFFLRSLAQDQQEHSIGVILSGMGSDGTLGLRAIKEKAGVVLVQEPKTAKFDGMPRSAIGAGLADIVAPVDELPAKIIAYLHRTPLVVRKEVVLEDKTQSALEKAIILLRAHTGQDFTLYKRNTLYRRIERRMGIHQIGKMSGYVRYLQENSQELDLLFKELLIGVTNFFRDPAAWDELRHKVLPELIASRPDGHVLRAWVPGCSTGEEAYSLAMVFKEVIEKIKPKRRIKLQVFATDLDKDAVEKARQGLYPENISVDVPPEQMRRFFTKEETGCRVRKEIREMVIFAPQNLIMDPPFTKLDILSCRNLLIYLTAEVQKKLIPLFHYSLSPGGILCLGSAETIGNYTELFTSLSGKSRIYRRSDSIQRAEPIEFPTSFAASSLIKPETQAGLKPTTSLQTLADQLILNHYAPPAVLANDKGDILYISGRTGKYLEPAAGKANWNLFAMVRDGLRYEVADAFQKAARKKESVVLRGLKVGTNGGSQFVDVTLRRLEEPEALQGLVMIVFTDVSAPAPTKATGKAPPLHARNARVAELEEELLRARAEARATHEEMQTSQEELRSTNEELQSTNEELQSTNEELTTSKEEMQSLNEELQTVNTELQSKVEDFSQTSDDMTNLLNSTDIATLFLDNDLKVRRFTPQATKIIKLIPTDEGRPITDLASNLSYPELADDAREVLRKLVSVEKPIGASDGRWFTVRIMPYRTLDDRIDGVVITFADITVSKTLEAKLRGLPAGQRIEVAQPTAQRAKAGKRTGKL